MNMQSLFTLLPFIVLVIGITRVYCTIKEIYCIERQKRYCGTRRLSERTAFFYAVSCGGDSGILFPFCDVYHR